MLLAHAETSLGHPERATDALELAPQAIHGCSRRSRGFTRRRKTGTRRRDVRAALRLESRQRRGQNEVGRSVAAGGRRQAGEQSQGPARGGQSAAPTEARPLYLFSMAERKRRDYSAAETAARRLITLDPTNASGAFALAQVYEDQRRYGKAADVLAPAVARIDTDEGRAPARPARAAGASRLRAAAGWPGRRGHQDFQSRAIADRPRHQLRHVAGAGVPSRPGRIAGRRYRANCTAPAADEPRYAELEARAMSQAGRRIAPSSSCATLSLRIRPMSGAQLTFAQLLEDAGRTAEADGTLKRWPTGFPASSGALPAWRAAREAQGLHRRRVRVSRGVDARSAARAVAELSWLHARRARGSPRRGRSARRARADDRSGKRLLPR